MSLKLKEFTFYGKHEAIQYTAPELQVTRTKFQGIQGTSEINGRSGLRYLQTNIWIYRTDVNYTAASLREYLRNIDNVIGLHGELTDLDSTYKRSFNHITFEGFFPHRRGPIEDTAGSLGWWVEGVLKFVQLHNYYDTG
jgi:hypothetical protein